MALTPHDPDAEPVIEDVDDIETPTEFTPNIDVLRENMRGYIALGLLGLLVLEVLIGSVAISTLAGYGKTEAAKLVGDWLNGIMTATVGLFGAATGFYFGAKAGS